MDPVQHYNLGIGPVTCHAWNKDRTQIAVSPNNNEIHILAWRGRNWERTHILTEHDLPITGIDWAPNSNRIVSCSQDKNAFVWALENNVWKPELVLLRVNRAATCVKWSPLENKFAVGSAAKIISVCYYERENDWWVAKQIKKPIRSTVTSIDWHPNNILIAVGACDYKTRIFSAYVKEVDEKPGHTPWGTKLTFSQMITEYSNGGGGWVHCVKFSPNGSRLAWVGHDSSVSVIDAGAPVENGPIATEANKVPKCGRITTVKEWYLPFTTLDWVSENSIVVAGHDCCPYLFTYNGPDQLKFVSKLDVPSVQKSPGASSNTALRRWQNMSEKGAEENDTSVRTLHQNTITQISIHSGPKNNVAKFCTTGLDGLVVLWDLQALQKAVDKIRVT